MLEITVWVPGRWTDQLRTFGVVVGPVSCDAVVWTVVAQSAQST